MYHAWYEWSAGAAGSPTRTTYALPSAVNAAKPDAPGWAGVPLSTAVDEPGAEKAAIAAASCSARASARRAWSWRPSAQTPTTARINTAARADAQDAHAGTRG